MQQCRARESLSFLCLGSCWFELLPFANTLEVLNPASGKAPAVWSFD
jgi:hypothetical protein